jgi:SAM-dependent methyltransferase
VTSRYAAFVRTRTFDPRKPLPPVGFLATPAVRLFLTSGTILFVELALIRWIPGNVIYVGYFTNFILIASFLGIGLGILLGRRYGRLPISPFGPLLFVVVAFIAVAQLEVKLNSANEMFYGLLDKHTADVNFLVLPLVVGLVVAVMAALSLPLGALLRAMPPLRAYAIDIVGSMSGIAAFAVFSAMATDPVIWFATIGGLVLLLALGAGLTPWSIVGGMCLVGAIAVTAQFAVASGDVWSPYYRIATYDASLHRASARAGSTDQPYLIHVNGLPHQSMVRTTATKDLLLHEQLYRWFPDRSFERIAIIGAGSGTDTALALAHGAGHIDAVEIDPEIARIGREFHPDRPYDDPRVTLVINDGRAFLRTSNERYDLIVLALTDSLTLVSSNSNIRLESFLYTAEALRSARDHLTPDGVFVMYDFYQEPWVVGKLHTLLRDTFGRDPAVRLFGPAAAVLAAGPGVTAALDGSATPLGDSLDSLAPAAFESATPATDDWPFPYLQNPGIAPWYVLALAIVLVMAAVGVLAVARTTGIPINSFSPHFFMLGVAFLLLETRSVTSFSLLFGTTWVVNALAFFAILGSVLLAIAVNIVRPVRRAGPLYAALFASVAVAFLLPPESVLIDPPALRYGLAATIAFAPVFFANLVFTYSFRDTRAADMAFASNLLGAVVGGILEYVALVTGYRALLLIVAGLYAAAYAFTRWRRMGDMELARGVPESLRMTTAETAG